MHLRNSGKPIKLAKLEISGVTAEAARGGEQVKVWTRLSITSDDPKFHIIANGLDAVLRHSAEQDGKIFSLSQHSTIFVVIKGDASAEVWLDKAAVTLRMIAKRQIEAMTVVFESDIADIIGMDFPAIKIRPDDAVICIFREGWRYGLYFDFNPDGRFDSELMSRSLGTLVRNLRYRQIYDAIAEPAVIDPLMAAGWFPFVELASSEFKELVSHQESGFDLAGIETKIEKRFGREDLERLLSRWLTKPHFLARELLLREAIESYLDRRPAATIKIILTEIEGILRDSYRAIHGRSAKIKTLLEFATQSAEAKVGVKESLMFPDAFTTYLSRNTFADFNPDCAAGSASSRHAVGHGAAASSTYTQKRALQSLLTLDQFCFYI
jgi:hypothetical protein